MKLVIYFSELYIRKEGKFVIRQQIFSGKKRPKTSVRRNIGTIKALGEAQLTGILSRGVRVSLRDEEKKSLKQFLSGSS